MRSTKKNKKKAFKIKFNKDTLKNALLFLLFFFIFFLIIFLVLSKTVLYKYINYFFGISSNFLLNTIFSVPSVFSFDTVSVLTINSLSYPVYISFLCTGVLEFSLLSAAILASHGFSWKKRVVGILIGTGVLIFFNILRISLTVFLITELNLKVASFFHGFLFRLFLVIIVLGTYYFWLKKIN
ncbi:MAG TPA: exosortase/archaeosortase family protein [Candidatus Diapherotrites archaeon]|jgi:exosortase/archaeosortase family protein|nr:exosortase/archaeosortase family protein [Candidatus Diapherotrites archaeon]